MKLKWFSYIYTVFHEARWRGNKAREFGDRYKLIYGGTNLQGRNGVGTILSSEMKDLVTEINRKDDRIIWMRFGLTEFSLNVFSVYAPNPAYTLQEGL